MYFLDSTTMIQLALERQRDLTKGVQVSSPRESYYVAPREIADPFSTQLVRHSSESVDTCRPSRWR